MAIENTSDCLDTSKEESLIFNPYNRLYLLWCWSTKTKRFHVYSQPFWSREGLLFATQLKPSFSNKKSRSEISYSTWPVSQLPAFSQDISLYRLKALCSLLLSLYTHSSTTVPFCTLNACWTLRLLNLCVQKLISIEVNTENRGQCLLSLHRQTFSDNSCGSKCFDRGEVDVP